MSDATPAEAPLITPSELADLRARLARAEARVKELEATPAAPPAIVPAPAIAPPPPADPLPAAALAPAPLPALAAPPPTRPLPVALPRDPVISLSPAPLTPSLAPFDMAKRRRRFMIVAVSAILLIVGTFVTITVVSQLH